MFHLDTSHWYVTRAVFLLAGTLVLITLGLAVYTGQQWWLAGTALVGAMEVVFSLTGFCPGAVVLHALGVSRQ